MKPESTPECITPAIKELCEKQVGKVAPVYLPVIPKPWCLELECFNNVYQTVRRLGGKPVYGWTVWQWANLYVELEAHSIWETPEGELIDVTPHEGNDKEILFIRDNKMTDTGEKVKNIRLALTNSPLVAEFISLSDERDTLLCNCYPYRTLSRQELEVLRELEMRREEIKEIFYRKTKPNEPCPCGSGMKYKKCCGKY